MRILTIILSLVSVSIFGADEISQKKAEYSLKVTTSLAQQGDPNAQFQLGQYYQLGRNVKTDPVEAVKWFRKAADQGHARALCLLGSSYVRGYGVKKDMSEAIKCYHKAAVLGSSTAYEFFTDCYTVDNGLYLDSGLSKNDIEAYAYSILKIGWEYENSYLCKKLTPEQIEAGKLRSRELKKQFRNEWLQQLKQLAEQGDIKSQLTLGAYYQVGIASNGFDGEVSRDTNEAIKWYTLAASKGSNEALMSLGQCYLNLKKIDEAIKWYTLAVDKGNKQALMSLGQCYRALNDLKQAIKFYIKALSSGNTSAKNSLSECYQTLGLNYKNGRGVDKDLNESYAYYKLSLATNPANPSLKHYLETLERDMTPEQIEAGEKRSKEIQTQMEATQ
jgi:TPR repeat protein